MKEYHNEVDTKFRLVITKQITYISCLLLAFTGRIGSLLVRSPTTNFLTRISPFSLFTDVINVLIFGIDNTKTQYYPYITKVAY